MVFQKKGNSLIRNYENEQLWIEAYGDGLRVRATQNAQMMENDWALSNAEPAGGVRIEISEESAVIVNGKIKAVISKGGKITFSKGETILLEEYMRNWQNPNPDSHAIKITAREFIPILGGDYKINVRFEAKDDEKIFGMGQYQLPYLDLKGCILELAQRNSQVSIPFTLSSRGYGFLWNNPAIGRASFGKNMTEWESCTTNQIDYWITTGDDPKEIIRNFTAVTGRSPMMPENVMGLWQCKLRYQTQEEVLQVAREYKRRGLPLDVIIVDFFHWKYLGDWKFDEKYWPDPKAMVLELKKLGIRLMVSIWPTVERNSENYIEMNEKGLLVRTDRGLNEMFDFMSFSRFYDATNPEARAFIWNKVKENYYNYGIDMFWLDEAEPEYSVYDFDNYRYYLGSNAQVGNIYPKMHAQAFYEGMEKAGQKNIINLVRCAWTGSQKYGTVVWSGDIPSTFQALRNQLAAGLNMGLCGIPWWTTDIGGFHGGNVNDPAFIELLIRWYQFGVYSPIFRMHGDRFPHKEPLEQNASCGGGMCFSGAPNEIWSYGENAYEIFKKYLNVRIQMKPYIKTLMEDAHINGYPVIRPMFFDYPEDENCWNIKDQYMFGPDILAAPVLYPGMRRREVYLPQGSWKNINDGKVYSGNIKINCEAPIEYIPVFKKYKNNL